jgi:hypothetical protein
MSSGAAASSLPPGGVCIFCGFPICSPEAVRGILGLEDEEDAPAPSDLVWLGEFRACWFALGPDGSSSFIPPVLADCMGA